MHRKLWAKIGRDGSYPERYHPLACHLLDVGEVCRALWRDALGASARAWVAEALGLPEADAGRHVALWVGLHDLGKATPGFQRLAPEAERLLRGATFDFDPDARNDPPHGTFSVPLVRDALAARFGLPRPLAVDVGLTVGGHHGEFADPVRLSGLAPSRFGRAPAWAAAREAIIEYVAGALGVPAGGPRPAADELTPPVAAFLAGLTTVADWVGSMDEHFPYAGGDVDPEAYRAVARGRAEAAVRAVGLAAAPALAPATFGELFPGRTPRPLQERAIGAAGRLTGPGLVLVEAPMGEGKTEAALFLADRWVAGGLRGTYVALPTQATGNQMFGRVRAFLERRYLGMRVNFHLLHGGSALSEAYRQLRVASLYGNPAVVAEEWFAPRRRGLLAPFAVGTVDQPMLAALQTRHYFVRLLGLARRVVVIDEVHAYDAYMNVILERLIAWLRATGSAVVLLSATLPKRRREALLRAAGVSGAPEAAYPRLVAADFASGAAWAESFPAARRWTVRLGRVPAAELADRLADALAPAGGCVAVIRNTVREAQDTYEALCERFEGTGFGVELFHARFPAGRRAEIESAVESRFGPEADRPRAAVLVATQVVEQSLDLDFDLMVSDWAPADLLLQRVGRLHRHAARDAGRPAGLREPTLWLLDPESADADGVPNFGATEVVYDRAILLRSHLALSGRESVTLPDDLEPTIERVYGDEPLAVPAAWAGPLAAAQAKQDRERGEAEAAARLVLIGDPAGENFLFEPNRDLNDDEDAEVHRTLRAATRQGDPTVSLVCLKQSGGQWRPLWDADPPMDALRPRPGEETRRLVRATLKLSQPWVVRAALAGPVPPGWRDSALLRHCRPLCLGEDDSAQVGVALVRLDRNKGAVIEKADGKGRD